jgi:putative phosphonate metabolism protein
MTEFSRYAVYYAPPEGSALAGFGAAWLGWDAASGEAAPHPECAVDVAAITATPRKYGFHGTMSAPLRLAHNQTLEAFGEAVSEIARQTTPFQTPPLKLKRIGSFLALVPSEPSQALNALHLACVKDLYGFRAAATEAELAKRRANNLTSEQDALLQRWGYPYVLQEFRFHLTLSGRLDAETAGKAESVLRDLTAPFCQKPFEVMELALFAERARDGRFQIIRRYPLTG